MPKLPVTLASSTAVLSPGAGASSPGMTGSQQGQALMREAVRGLDGSARGPGAVDRGQDWKHTLGSQGLSACSSLDGLRPWTQPAQLLLQDGGDSGISSIPGSQGPCSGFPVQPPGHRAPGAQPVGPHSASLRFSSNERGREIRNKLWWQLPQAT